MAILAGVTPSESDKVRHSALASENLTKKSYMRFRLVPKSVTLNDLERRKDRYIGLFHCIWLTCVPTRNRLDLWRNLCTSLLYFVLRVRCRRKESLCSLSHLLMSFLLVKLKLNLN